MGHATLTALAVQRAHRSGEPVLLGDGDGLYLRKQTRDGASWTLRYRFAGREHWLTLGHYPDMSLAEARIEARQARVLLDKQQDPLSVRRAAEAEQRQRGSFRELCEAWYRSEITGAWAQTPGCAAPASRQIPASEARSHCGGGCHAGGHRPRHRRTQGTRTDRGKRPAALHTPHLRVRRAPASGA
jgi:hypothetical protein